MNMLKNNIKDITFHIFDTETTGKNAHDKPIEVSIIKYQLNKLLDFKNWLINPGILIHPSARAIHGISDEMVSDKPTYEQIKDEIINFISDKVILAHNIEFDLKMIPELNQEEYIKLDILCLAKKLFKIGDLNEKGQDLTTYQSQELRFWLGLEIDTMNLPAHRATADVIVSAHIFDVILNKFIKQNLGQTLEDLINFHNTPILIDSFSFGKYKGRNISDSLEEDKNNNFTYIKWLMPKIYSQEFKIDSDMIYSLEFYMEKMDILKHFKKISNQESTPFATLEVIPTQKINTPFKLNKKFGVK